jgi:hypothetical protein
MRRLLLRWVCSVVLACSAGFAAADRATGAEESPVASATPQRQLPQAAGARAAATNDSAAAEQRAWAQRLQRNRSAARNSADPFSSKTWVVPPKPAPAPRPIAPPFPFRFLGKIVEQDHEPKLFLTRGDNLRTVSPGETLDGKYRIDAIGESAVEVTYLPLQAKQRFTYLEITPTHQPSYAQTKNPADYAQRGGGSDSPAPDSATQPIAADNRSVNTGAGTGVPVAGPPSADRSAYLDEDMASIRSIFGQISAAGGAAATNAAPSARAQASARTPSIGSETPLSFGAKIPLVPGIAPAAAQPLLPGSAK